MAKTEYRAARTDLGQYKLQFKRTVYAFSVGIKDFWCDIPKPGAVYLGHMTQQNSDSLANMGYGYCFTHRNPEDFRSFTTRYPDIEQYITVFNKERDEYLVRKAIDDAKPTIVNL